MDVRMLFSVSVAAVMTVLPQAAEGQGSSRLADVAVSWMQAFEARDPAAIASYFDENVVAHYPGWDVPTSGRQANQAAWARYFDRRPHHPLSTDSVVVSEAGDIGYTMGQALYAAETDPEATGGRYVAIWRRNNGDWKVVVFAAHSHSDISSETFRSGNLYQRQRLDAGDFR